MDSMPRKFSLKQDKRVPKILTKSRQSIKNVVPAHKITKDENERIEMSANFCALKEQGKKAIDMLDALNKWCDAPTNCQNEGSNSPAKYRKNGRIVVVTDAIREIQKKNAEIHTILNEMSNHAGGIGNDGLMNVVNFDNVLKK